MLSASKSARTLADALASAALAFIVAPACAVCETVLEAPLAGAVCPRCWASVHQITEPLCEVCGDALATWRVNDGLRRQCARCRNRPRVISVGRAIGAYEGTLREIVHALKYGRRRSIALGLAERMIQAGPAVLDGADFLVPVPLHFVRHYRRGFNQASELARAMQSRVCTLSALRRRRSTATQTDLPEAQRHRNVDDAFTVRRRARRLIRDACIVLIDDVSTTGATLDACGRVLLRAGAKEIRALTAARAESRLQ